MYLQLTTRCNMLCPHCCFSCTSRGTDMSLETFRAALNYDEESISIGGGEPTLHPLFEHFLILAISKVQHVWIATNGKIKEHAMLLYRLAEKGVIEAELSQDQYHEPIDPEVVEAFNSLTCEDGWNRGIGKRGIRNTTAFSDPFLAGRAYKLMGGYGRKECACDDTFVHPSGRVTQCGCPRSPTIGNVYDGYNSVCWGECYQSQAYKEAKREAKVLSYCD